MLKALKLVMRRVKIPSITETFILNLFWNRQSRIITNLGLTEPFEITDEIEQEEVISSLIW